MLKKKSIGVMIVIALALALSFVGCDEKGSGDTELYGDVTITPDTNVMTGMALTVAYSGNEQVTSPEWKKDGIDESVSFNGWWHIPWQKGTYTATVRLAGNPTISKTSAPINVTDFIGTGGYIVRTDGKAWKLYARSAPESQYMELAYIFQQNGEYSSYTSTSAGDTFIQNSGGTWSVDGATLTLVMNSSSEDQTIIFSYSVIGDDLILSDSSGALIIYTGHLIPIQTT